MNSFSQRIGKKPIPSLIQKDGIDIDLKNSLWNVLTIHFFDSLSYRLLDNPESELNLCTNIWLNFFKYRLEIMPKISSEFVKVLRVYFYESEWYEVYDLFEFISLNACETEAFYDINRYVKDSNDILERELSAYRLVNWQLTEITSKDEIESIEQAVNDENITTPVRNHLHIALELFSDRKSPDYKNSIKESISAVESYCKIITGDQKATLGKALKEIQKIVPIHTSLQNAFSTLYGYTSEEGGIRHADILKSESTVDHEEAKFMLVACSAFINYLRQKESKIAHEQ